MTGEVPMETCVPTNVSSHPEFEVPEFLRIRGFMAALRAHARMPLGGGRLLQKISLAFGSPDNATSMAITCDVVYVDPPLYDYVGKSWTSTIEVAPTGGFYDVKSMVHALLAGIKGDLSRREEDLRRGAPPGSIPWQVADIVREIHQAIIPRDEDRAAA